MITFDISGNRIICCGDQNLRAIALNLPGANWRAKDSVVTMPLNLLSWWSLHEAFPEATHSPAMQTWRTDELKAITFGAAVNNGTLEVWDIPDLWESQAQALARIELGGSVLLADDKGLGKTRVVVEAIRRAAASKTTSAVVLSAKRVRDTWAQAGGLWWASDKVVVPSGANWSEAASQIGSAPITVLTYDSLLNADVVKAINKLDPDFLVVDEAHNLKKRSRKNRNKDTGVTTVTKSGVLRKLPGRCRIALTGDPAPNRWYEIWTLLNFVAPNVFGSFWQFVEVLGSVTASFWGGKDISERVLRMDIWEEVFDRWIVSRRKPKVNQVWEFVPIKLSQPEREAYQTMSKEWTVVNHETHTRLDASTHLARLVRLQQLAGGLGKWETTTDSSGRTISSFDHADPSAKVDALLERLDGLRRSVVFTRFRNRAEYVADRILGRGNAEPMLFTGAVSEKKSNRNLQRFFGTNPEPLVAVCVYGTVSEGVNELVSAQDIFFLDWGTAKDVSQAADRLDRPGQQGKVKCWVLYSEGTVDEAAIDREARKVRSLRSVLRAPDGWKYLSGNWRK